MYDDLIHELFPHRDGRGRPSYRTHQFEVIRDVLDAFDDESITDVVVEAPTGAGKTSIAVTVARVMTRDFPRVMREARSFDEVAAMAHMAEHQAHLITSMKMLQNAYLCDDPEIKLVKGKSNYECHKSPKQMVMRQLETAVRRLFVVFSCDEAEQIFGRTCENNCPYREARKAAQWAPIALHNFDSFLYQATMGQAFVPRRLLTVDEAHNGEEKLRGFMTMTFGPQLFESLDLVWTHPGDMDDMNGVSAWAQGCFDQVVRKIQAMAEKLKVLRAGRQGPEEIVHAAKLARSARRVSMLHDRLGRFCRSITLPNQARWVAYDNDQGEVTLEPVDAGRFVPSALMAFGRQRLHLSATFLNGSGSYTRSINLRGHEMISVPSTFPPERRRIVVKSAGKLGQKNWAKNFKNVVVRLKEVLKENRGVRGVIHCTSYGMAEEIRCHVNDRRLLFYERETREVVVDGFISGLEAPDAVLVAVALNEGYDFKYDLCRFQTIIRVPYIVPTKCVKARGEHDPRFYNWRTALALVQVYGRGMRSEDDECRTYVLDQRFEDFVKRERDQLPGWFLEAIS